MFHNRYQRTAVIRMIQLITLVAVSVYIPTSGAAIASKLSKERCNNPLVGVSEQALRDYREYGPTHERIEAITLFHFTPEIRTRALYGIGGKNPYQVASDIDYTLRKIPNHPDALNAMAALHAREYNKIPNYFATPRVFMPAYCYFRRAIAFAPDDASVRNLYGIYFQRVGKLKEALEQFQKVVDMQPNSAKARYNLGLIYYALKQYKNSAAAAKAAYKLGYKKFELKKRLKRKGFW